MPSPREGNPYTPGTRLPPLPFSGCGDEPAPAPCATAGLFRRSALSWCEGRLDAGLRYADAAATTTCEADHELCAAAPFWRIALLIKARELDAGWRALDTLHTPTTTTAANPRLTATAQMFRGELLFAAGYVDQGLTEVTASLRAAKRHGVRSLLPTGYVVMALAALRRADMRTALHYIDKLTDEAILGYFGQAAGAWVTAQATEARSGVHSVADLITGIVTNPHILRQLLVSEPAAAPWLIRAATKLHATDLTTTTLTAIHTATTQQPRLTVLRATALHATGLHHQDPTTLRDAANLHPDQWCAASAREDLADLLTTQHHHRDTTIHHYETALTTYTTLNATRDAARITNKLRDLGIRRTTTRTTTKTPHTPHNHLTNTEHAVAELVAQGHTNNEVGRQLFISRHTVAFHLKKVYQKMNVTSRVELAATWKTHHPTNPTKENP